MDLSEERFTNIFPYAWPACYRQKAYCVRILCPAHEVIRSSEIPNIKRIKFITKEENSHKAEGYTWYAPPADQLSSESELYETLNIHLDGFDFSEISSKYWKEICSLLAILNFKYKKESSESYWTTEILTSEDDLLKKAEAITLVQQKFIGKFGGALQADMKNGEAKSWMSALIDTLLHSCDMRDELHCDSPPVYCSTNTSVEIIRGNVDDPATKMHYNSPYSSTPSSSYEFPFNFESLSLESVECSSEISSGSVKKNTVNVVPGVCVMSRLPPGFIPLVVEMKPAGKMSSGFFQNVKQMLSKLFFQDVIFGMIISPLSYRFLVIFKKEGVLHFESTSDIAFCKKTQNLDKSGTVTRLDLERLTGMCTFIYRILRWSLKTKCMLKKTDSLKGNHDTEKESA